MYTEIHALLYIHTHLCIHIYKQTPTHASPSIKPHYIQVHVFVYVRVCVYIDIYTHTNTYIYSHTHIFLPSQASSSIKYTCIFV